MNRVSVRYVYSTVKDEHAFPPTGFAVAGSAVRYIKS